jgi:hypothetical protein
MGVSEKIEATRAVQRCRNEPVWLRVSVRSRKGIVQDSQRNSPAPVQQAQMSGAGLDESPLEECGSPDADDASN